MEQFPLSQKESGVNRVVGFESEKEGEFLQYFKDRFEANSLRAKEKEKTTEQQELIERINAEMYSFLSEYGVEAINIPSENIHIVDRTKFTADELKDIQDKFGTESGYYSSNNQSVVIIKDYDTSKISFFQTLVHEMLHMQGFYSYQKSEQEDADLTLRNGEDLSSMNIRRSGFSIGTTDGERLLFHKLNESVITELAIRFEELFMAKWAELANELDVRKKYVEEFASREGVSVVDLQRKLAYVHGDEITGYEPVNYPYIESRKKFDFLVGTLYEKNKDEFKSKEDVFKLFAKATMTGKLMPIARLIEKTFGKGSFRKIGEMSADKPKLED